MRRPDSRVMQFTYSAPTPTLHSQMPHPLQVFLIVTLRITDLNWNSAPLNNAGQAQPA